MNPYQDYVKNIERNFMDVKSVQVKAFRKDVLESEQVALLFSPHPDDECITGLLPLRLMQEKGMKIVNVPVTFGSNVNRRKERSKELEEACALLGWTIYQPTCDFDPLLAQDIALVLARFSPEVIFLPHVKDANSTHIAVNHLVMDALRMMNETFSCKVVETEFWYANEEPNLMIEGSTEQVADLMAATALHRGEVARNPYHLLLPAWMQDNVRRGSERVGGQGRGAPDFSFATLYRLRKWESACLSSCLDEGMMVPVNGKLLKEIF